MTTPAGWYDDPHSEGHVRWWDGLQWTDSTQSRQGLVKREEQLPVPAASGDRDPDVLWEATGRPLTGIGAGRYKLTNFYLFFERGALRTDAQQVPVASLLDIDVRQSMSQKARGVGNIIVHIQRATRVEIVTIEDVPNFREGQRAINEASAAARAHLRTAQNTSHVSYSGQPPFGGGQQQLPPAAHEVLPPVDYVAQLEKLGQLRDAGILTEEEFSAKKSEILRRI